MPYYLFYIFFIILYAPAVVIFFVKKEWNFKYRKWLINAHILSIVLLVIDIFLIAQYNLSYQSLWLDRIWVLGFFCLPALSFALYRRQQDFQYNLYFGPFFFYPAICGLAYIINKGLFLLVAFPILFSLDVPIVYYSDGQYEIREVTGIFGPRQIKLIEKSKIWDKEFAITEYDPEESSDQQVFTLQSESKDSIVFTSKGDREIMRIVFKK